MIDKSEYAKWLTSQIDHYGRYHNHKETMAWVVTALYVPGILYLGYNEGGIWRGLCAEIAVIVIMLLAGSFIWLFVNMQFRMRWYASDAVAVCMRCLAKLNSGADPPPPDEWEIEEKDKYCRPKFMKREMEKEQERDCKEALRKLFLCCRWSKDELDDRWKTELPSYIVIFLATLFAMYLAVWN